MARIPRDIIDAVRDRTNLTDVISRHVTLQRAGKDYKGLCPFHQEKSPSFHVVPSKGIYHCFGCQEGGDVFKFLMKVEGLSFMEAVKELAGPAGVVIEERELSPAERTALRSRSTLFDVLEEAASFYESILWTHPDGQPGRDYLDQRQLSTPIARRARVGFAPEGWTRLTDHLHNKGFGADKLVEAGLARPRRSGSGHIDMFRGRLLFPIRDERGRVLGFGGRLLDGDGPKYINTTETRLYDKKRVLYGLHVARGPIQRTDRAIVVEGYFDVLAMQEAGFDEAIATCGTAVTPDHLERLRRITRNVLLLTDGDRAGQAAAERTLPLLLGAGLHGFRVELPGAKDPDDYLRAHGAEALGAALERRQSLVEWVVDRKVRQYADQTSRGLLRTAQASERVLDELRPVLRKLHSRQLSRIAGMLGISDGELNREVSAQPESGPPPRAAPALGWRPERDIVHIFWLLVHRYDQVADLLQRVPTDIFSAHPAVQPAMARLLTGEPAASIIGEESDEGVRRTLLAVVARQTLYEVDHAARGMCDMLDRLLRPRLDARSRFIKRAINDGERSDVPLRELLVERKSLIEQSQKLDRALKTDALSDYLDALTSTLDALGSVPGLEPDEPLSVDDPPPSDVPEVPSDLPYDDVPPWQDEDIPVDDEEPVYD